MSWFFLFLFSFLTGTFYLKFLTVHPIRMHYFLSLTWIGLFASGLLFFHPLIKQAALLGIGIWIVVFFVGYGLANEILLRREDQRSIPHLIRKKGDTGKGHLAVIYFTHGEPETYDPIGWLNQFREFDEQRIKFVPRLVRPLFIYQLRKSYLKVGMSKHRQIHQRMLRSLEHEFRQAGDFTTKFYLCFLDDNPRPDAAVIQALNEGASQIVVAEVFVSVSNHTLEGKHLIDALHIEELGVEVYYTGPMWDSMTLHQMFVERANAHLDGIAKEKVGILLVGHGQPDEWDREFATETEHELAFRQSILERLAEDGYRRENLSLAWMEFKRPKPKEMIEQFLRNGVERVFYFSAAISADSIHSQYDVPKLVEKAKVPVGFPLINLGGWNDDPLVIRAIKEKIEIVTSQRFVDDYLEAKDYLLEK